MAGKKSGKHREFLVPEEELVALIHNSVLFGTLDEQQCRTLIDFAEELIIEPGAVLFAQGDFPDAFYLVVSGQLIAHLAIHEEERAVGFIMPGETVGELGALSKKPRSLTVIAEQKSILLKLTQNAMMQFWDAVGSIQFQMHMIDTMISRSQSVLKLLANEKLLKHIAIIPATAAPIDADFIQQLKKNIRSQDNLLLVDEDYFHQNQIKVTLENIHKIMDNTSDTDQKIIFVLNKHPCSEGDKCLYTLAEAQLIFNSIDALYAVANTEQPAELNPDIRYLFEKKVLPFVTKKELILIHSETDASQATQTEKWLRMASFNLHHHVRKNKTSDFQKLIRFINDIPLGLVLGGGGVKGWASLGVIKALVEADIPIDAIGGTSAGAIVAASFAMTQDYEQTFEMLKPFISMGHGIFSVKNLSYPLISLTNGKLLTLTIQRLFSDLRLEDSWLLNFGMTTNLNNGEEIRNMEGLIWKSVRSSVSLPLVYPPVVENGQMLVDGGLLNNLPVDQMRRLIGTNSYIIAVLLSNSSNDTTQYQFPPIMPFSSSLMTKLQFDKNNYKCPPITDIMVNSFLVGSAAKTNTNAAAANLLINPDLDAFPLLGLKPQKIMSLIEMGYNKTRQQLHTIPFPYRS